MSDIVSAKASKARLLSTYSNQIMKLGLNMAVGLGRNDGKYSLEVRLSPVHTADADYEKLTDNIKRRALPATYDGFPVNIRYVGKIEFL